METNKKSAFVLLKFTFTQNTIGFRLNLNWSVNKLKSFILKNLNEQIDPNYNLNIIISGSKMKINEDEPLQNYIKEDNSIILISSDLNQKKQLNSLTKHISQNLTKKEIVKKFLTF